MAAPWSRRRRSSDSDLGLPVRSRAGAIRRLLTGGRGRAIRAAGRGPTADWRRCGRICRRTPPAGHRGAASSRRHLFCDSGSSSSARRSSSKPSFSIASSSICSSSGPTGRLSSIVVSSGTARCQERISSASGAWSARAVGDDVLEQLALKRAPRASKLDGHAAADPGAQHISVTTGGCRQPF